MKTLTITYTSGMKVDVVHNDEAAEAEYNFWQQMRHGRLKNYIKDVKIEGFMEEKNESI